MIGDSTVFTRRLLGWYGRHRRDLPWRLPLGAARDAALDPYHVLLSEAMLQQTQVVTAIPYFRRFVERLPTLGALAAAEEQEVLRLWQGLGYYSRARNLHAAAKMVMREFDGRIPEAVEDLLKLPGVGRYTAGAVASIAFGRRAPIVDGNVARVLCRLDCIQTDPREKRTLEYLWKRAEQLLPKSRLGDFNSALMELGATVCTPRAPRCESCPVRCHCRGRAAGAQESLPLKAARKPMPLERRWVVCVRREKEWLIERRPAKGRWAGLWQFITVVAEGKSPSRRKVCEHVGLKVGRLVRVGALDHTLSHRRYHFEVYVGETSDRAGLPENPLRRWSTLNGLDQYPLSRPQQKIAELLKDQPASMAACR